MACFGVTVAPMTLITVVPAEAGAPSAVLFAQARRMDAHVRGHDGGEASEGMMIVKQKKKRLHRLFTEHDLHLKRLIAPPQRERDSLPYLGFFLQVGI